MKDYNEILDYAKKIGLENTPQYKKVKYALDNFNNLNKEEQEKLKEILNNLLIKIIDNDEKGFIYYFGF